MQYTYMQASKHAPMVMWGLQEVAIDVKVVWRCVLVVYGAPSAMMDGDLPILVLCAGNLDMYMRVLD